MYNWVVNGIPASLNNKELLIFDNGNDSLYIESTNWLLCWKKDKRVSWKWKILNTRRNAETWSESQAEFDLVYQPSQRWKVAPIQQRLSKRENILNFPVFITLCYYRVYIPFCQLVICHSLPQLLLICLQSIFWGT